MLLTMVTTDDNPYDPFDQHDMWFAFDQRMGYNTPTLLARLCPLSLDSSVADRQAAMQDAVDEVVRENVLGIYKKVTKEVEDQK